MKKGTENMNKNTVKNVFYKTNPRGGISLIVLVITIIVVIILAAAVIISLQNNNPMVEANKARINSDVANMQAIFTNTVGKIMAENQDVVTIVGGPLYTTPTGNKKTIGEATYKIVGEDGTSVVEGKIKFSAGEKLGTTYYTGKELPLYGSDTKWSVDNQGLLSVEVGGITYGEGAQVEEEGEEIVESENPMLQSWTNSATTDFHAEEYKSKITKIKFATNVKVPNNKIESWDVSKDKDGSVMSWIQSDGAEGYILTIAGRSKLIANTDSSYLFYKFTNLKEIENLKLLDTNNVTNMQVMFNSCSSLTSLELTNFNTGNVTNMDSMFFNCSSLTSLDLSNFNTSNVTSMNGMFGNCNNLTNLELSGFDTSKVTNMNGMFIGCESLRSLNLSSFDTSNVTSMINMFYRCESLASLDLSNFNTSNVTAMNYMFGYCKSIENLNLSNFDTSKVTDMSDMFNSCRKLTTTININGINLSSYNSIFLNAATESTAQITVNYSSETASKIDSIISQKSSNSNIVKGVQVD